MFQLVPILPLFQKKTAKTVRDSPGTFSPALVCVCAFACLASWLRNRIRRDFATITLTGEGGSREEIQSLSTDTKWHWASCSCLQEALCQNRFLVRCFWTEMTIELALLCTCSTAAWKIFQPPPPQLHTVWFMLFIWLFCKHCCFMPLHQQQLRSRGLCFSLLPFVDLILKNRLLMKRLEQTFVCGENI